MAGVRQRTSSAAAPSSPVQAGPPSRTDAATSPADNMAGSQQRQHSANAAAAAGAVYDPPPKVEPYQLAAIIALGLTVVLGTFTSLLFSSSSITSFRGRLPATSHKISFNKAYLPGPLSQIPLDNLLPNYFANKRNVLNVIFVKKAWAWTTLAFALHWLAGVLGSGSEKQSGVTRTEWRRKMVYAPVRRYAVATIYWLLFTTWFFGPSFSDRVLLLSGAECVPASLSSSSSSLSGLPDVDATHAQSINDPNHVVDNKHCFSQPDDIFLPENSDTLASGASSASSAGFASGTNTDPGRVYWKGGHDISGHSFLLTLSSLLLITEIGPTLSSFGRQTVAASNSVTPTLSPALTRLEQVNKVRRTAALLTLGLVGIWWWMLLMTSLFFHTPQEKISGFIVGIGAWWSSWRLAA